MFTSFGVSYYFVPVSAKISHPILPKSGIAYELMTRHCHNCGWEYTLPGLPGRTESCHRCGADLKICLNCVSYDPRLAHQCRDRRADPVAEKHMANFCEYFDFVRREWTGKKEANTREASARDSLKKLLGD